MAVAELVGKQAENSDKIVIYYNEFKSAISSIIKRMELLPRKQFLDAMKF
jgi:F0F1-type ATP synthase gamma subunit